MFRGNMGTLFCTVKSQQLGHDLYLCHCEPASPPLIPVCNESACKGLSANGSVTFTECQ